MLREDFLVWLFRYKMASIAGRLFPTTFLGMTVQMWRILLDGAMTPMDIVKKYRRILVNNHELRHRPSDRLMTHLLLESSLCHLSPKNLVWKKLNATPPSSPARDALVCFHGYEWEPCDVNGSYDGDDDDCMWWRADRAHDREQLEQTFDEISQMAEW